MRARLVAVAVTFSLVLSVSKDELAQGKPNVLLITLDTVRADRMGFLGSTRGLTPALDAFARGSIVFTRAYSQAPMTTVSHATLLTGTYPPLHGVRDFGTPLPDSVPYLPDVLHTAGYRTAAFVGSLILDPHAGTAPGFDRGFDVYDAGFHLRRPGEDRYRSVERRGEEVVTRALKWLNPATPQASPASPTRPTSPARATNPRAPFFLWVHLFDAHDPYDPPGALKARYAASPYDGEIAEVDRLVGRLLNAAPPDTIVVVAADHGEALGDHGEETHGVFLYDATLHVPLVLRLPNRERAGMRVTSRVRLADVTPTLLEAAALHVPPAIQGESLMPLVRLKPDPTYEAGASGRASSDAASGSSRTSDRSVYSETDYPRQAFGWSGLISWRAGSLLFVRAPRRELYDERTDPRATKNLADAERAVADRSDKDVDQFIHRMAGGGGPQASSDPALARRLASLGYVGGGASPGASTIDPKDRIQTANMLRAAVSAAEDGAFAKAIPLLERVTASDPAIPIAQLNLGVARARVRQYAAAIASLNKAVLLDPQSVIAHYELASALYETGDLTTAAAHFAIVASRMPNWADARYSLGSVYARIDRVPDATSELKAALALEPRHFRANLLLGRILTLQGQAAAALPLLHTAVDVEPSTAEAHQFLADAYEKAGDAAEAANERRRAAALTKK
jgi:choline-sulfatase